MALVSTTSLLATIGAAIPLVGVVAWLVVRARRRKVDPLLDDPDYELVFPEGPDDQQPRRTTAGRRIARPHK